MNNSNESDQNIESCGMDQNCYSAHVEPSCITNCCYPNTVIKRKHVSAHIRSKGVAFELTGQPKLNGSRIGVLKEPPPMILNEFVPSTGVMALPKIQSPGDTTTW